MTSHSSLSANGGAGPDGADRGEGMHPLNRGLGVGAIVFMVVAAAAPLAVVAAQVPIVIAFGGSIGAPLFFLIAAVILTLFAVGYTLMSRHVRNAGAFYSYVQAGLGRINGLGAALLALVSYSMLLIAVYSYQGVAASNATAQYLHVDVPWWVFSFAAFAIVSVLGYRDIELSSNVLGVLLVAEVLIVVVLDVAILVKGGAAGLTGAPLLPATVFDGSPGLGLMFAFFAFFGFEATAVFRNEARDPDRTVPRATYVAVVSIGAFYALSAWAVVVGAGVTDAVDTASDGPVNMVFDLATRYAGPVVHDIMQLLVVTSVFACVLSFHNVITRYQFTLGAMGVLPSALGRVSPKYGAPSRSSIALTAISGVLLAVVAVSGIDPITQAYTWLSGAATLGIVLLMALTNLAVIVFFRTHDLDKRRWHTVAAPSLAILGLLAVVALVVTNFELLIGDRLGALIIGGLVLAAYGAGVAVALRMRRSRPAAYAALRDGEPQAGD
ncbi:APC family permease [Rhodococcus sp. USK10]|uniref:APC family permease n=1 Tax=Rhodococcus sp. USK10 TaxID=2789739 RepID=UPI001C5D309D|nr:APC family permease [Rhodococcus sp. USK10]QYB01772.1 APC family permease [Rhodococcus sp. USK10]